MNETNDRYAHFEMEEIGQAASYKLLASTIMPRPIAWITTRNQDGTLNAAPFSFFNIVSSDPPLVAVSFSKAPDRAEKDTLANVLATGEFTVNMVSEEQAEAMNVTAANAPRGLDEVAFAGLERAEAVWTKTAHIAGTPAAFECTLLQTMSFGGASTLLLGRIVGAHIRRDVFEDEQRLHVDPDRMRLIGRMHGAGGYTTTRGLFQIERKSWPIEK